MIPVFTAPLNCTFLVVSRGNLTLLKRILTILNGQKNCRLLKMNFGEE